jgi:hypothetical protein
MPLCRPTSLTSPAHQSSVTMTVLMHLTLKPETRHLAPGTHVQLSLFTRRPMVTEKTGSPIRRCCMAAAAAN